jgi:hypothetical protein
MKRRYVLGVLATALISMVAFSNNSVSQGKSLKDQLVGTWIYVSSTGTREDGSAVQRPSLQGAVTYTAEGHFHFITVRSMHQAILHAPLRRRPRPLRRAWLPTLEPTPWTKIPKRSTSTLRSARFLTWSEHLISAGS